jgi:hypothetical protein
MPERSPVVLDRPFDAENPIVLRLKSGRFIAVFDVLARPLAIGYIVSEDGISWSQASYIDIKRTPNLWVNDPRTPLGLIEEPDGTFTCFYTGYGTQAYAGYGCLGVLSLKLTEKPPKKWQDRFVLLERFSRRVSLSSAFINRTKQP